MRGDKVRTTFHSARLRGLMAIALSLATAAFMFPASPANAASSLNVQPTQEHAAAYVSGWGQIQALAGDGNMCLDAWGIYQHGQQLHIYTCDGTADQKWRSEEVSCQIPNTTCAMLRNMSNQQRFCLDVYGLSSANFTKAVLYECDPLDKAQLFEIVTTSIPYTYTIYGGWTGTSLDDGYANRYNGAKVDFYQNNLSLAQQWRPTTIHATPPVLGNLSKWPGYTPVWR
jgi:hypothetical protein